MQTGWVGRTLEGDGLIYPYMPLYLIVKKCVISGRKPSTLELLRWFMLKVKRILEMMNYIKKKDEKWGGTSHGKKNKILQKKLLYI